MEITEYLKLLFAEMSSASTIEVRHKYKENCTGVAMLRGANTYVNYGNLDGSDDGEFTPALFNNDFVITRIIY